MDKNSDLYLENVKRYTGRESLMKSTIAPLDCLWNDVVMFSSIDPQMRYEMIQTRAYYRAKDRDFAPGHEHADWLASEKEIDDMLGKK